MEKIKAVISPSNLKTSLVNYCHFNCDSKCCNSVILLQEEYYKLVENDLIKPKDPSIIVMQEFFIMKANQKTGKCRFLKNNFCIIQDKKPIDCKIWPLYYHPNKSSKIVNCDANCPIKNDLPNIFIKNALKEMDKIPEDLKEVFFRITESLGYELDVVLFGENTHIEKNLYYNKLLSSFKIL